MIERSHLEILRALGEEGTLTAAARRLCLTQPAITHQIQKLEGRTGAALWGRGGRGVRRAHHRVSGGLGLGLPGLAG